MIAVGRVMADGLAEWRGTAASARPQHTQCGDSDDDVGGKNIARGNRQTHDRAQFTVIIYI